jgi:hypothetical protein
MAEMAIEEIIVLAEMTNALDKLDQENQAVVWIWQLCNKCSQVWAVVTAAAAQEALAVTRVGVTLETTE